MIDTILKTFLLGLLLTGTACGDGSRRPTQRTPTADDGAAKVTPPENTLSNERVARSPGWNMAIAGGGAKGSTDNTGQSSSAMRQAPPAGTAAAPKAQSDGTTAGGGNASAVTTIRAQSYNLSDGRTLLLENTRASIKDRSGRVLAKNDHLIRMRDEHQSCMSEGFSSISVSKNRFVLEQQNCGGWYYIAERLEFRLGEKGTSAYLDKFSLGIIDRRASAQDPVVHALTAQEYGIIKFEDVRLERLYELVDEKKPKEERVPEEELGH